MAERAHDVRLIVDTDIGTDDALALLLAHRSSAARLELVTTVGGNTSAASATRNALAVLELCGERAPVCTGAATPFCRPAFPVRQVHGSDGFGDTGVPPPVRRPSAEPAKDALADLVLDDPGVYTLVTLGPLTNVALALEHEPRLAARLRACVVSGGALDPRLSPDFNFQADPEAAQRILSAGMPLTLVPLDLSRGEARIEPATSDEPARSPHTLAAFAGRLLYFLGESGRRRFGWNGEAAVPDAVAMAVALDPSLVTASLQSAVEVDTEPGDTCGTLHIVARGTNVVRVVTAIDVPRFHALVERCLT